MMNFPCERCKQARATVHITDTMPEKTERHLCENCAEKEGIILKQHHTTTNAILQEFIKQKVGLDTDEAPTCPKCGLSFREFQTSGQLGCPHDYEVFRSLLEPLIERAHEDATQHIGKTPGGDLGDTPGAMEGLVKLRKELQEAIEAENYERAAEVRDAIKSMEQANPEDSN